MTTQQNHIQQLQQHLARQQETLAQELAPQAPEVLEAAPAQGAWSVTACLEHLNAYARYYVPALEAAMAKANKPGTHWAKQPYSANGLGRWSINSVDPDHVKTKKMKARKNMNPSLQPASPKAAAALEEYGRWQKRLEGLLNQAPQVPLKKVKVRIEFARFLKLQAGDALQFLLVHQERHLRQALRAVEAVGSMPPQVAV